jgi:centromeric protein E
MMILCIQDIFDWVDKHSNTKFILRVSYMEVYNEEINDLLGDGVNSKNLRIVSEDANRGVTIGGLVEEICKNVDDFMSLLARGEEARSYASTNMNADSSRSHTIYRVCIEAKDLLCENNDQVSNSSSPPTASISTKKSLNRSLSERMSNSDLPDRVSYLNLVDLAGSERQKSTGATGKTLKEGSMINRSLLTLGAVISKLSEACKKTKNSKPVFVPFRDSKLTRILKQSLGGNTLTSVRKRFESFIIVFIRLFVCFFLYRSYVPLLRLRCIGKKLFQH